ncbi:MAG: PKD domain-containing protein [Steroidobacteraceae bacterium]
MKKRKPGFIAVISIILCLSLVACGGGGGGTTASVASSGGGGSGGGGGGGATPPLSATCADTVGDLSLTAGVARNSGVAPLGVFFDATATTHANPLVKTFHDIQYQWNFADAGSGNWTNGSRLGSRNTATGPLAAHVFEAAGTYNVTVTAFDGTNTATCQVQVVVDDPNTFFANANTVCFTNGVDLTGCPGGGSVIGGTNDFAVVKNALAAGKRVLMRRGDTFDVASAQNVTVNGPWILGAYGGAGAKPVIRNTGGAITMLQIAPAVVGSGDMRIMDINIDGQSNGGARFSTAASSVNQLTFLRVDIQNIGAGFSFNDTLIYDQFFIVDSTVTNITNGYGYFGPGQRFALMGNLFDQIATLHNVRLPTIQKGIISNNRSSNAFGDALKIHGSPFATTGRFTEQVIVSDNKFEGGGSTLTLWIQPQNLTSDERIRNVLVERNWFTAGPGQAQAFVLLGSEFTVRNNIINLTGALSQLGIRVNVAGHISPPPDNVRILNNTIFGNNVAGFAALFLEAGSSNVTIANNLAYSPNSTNARLLDDLGSIAPLIISNSSNSQIKNDSPSFTVTPPSAPLDFKLTAGSYAIDIGTGFPSVRVFSDFFEINRPMGLSIDIGASEQ